MNVADIAAEVDARLRAKTDPERQAFTRGYFPSALENLGVAVPHIRSVVRDLKRRCKKEEASVVLKLAHAILRQKTLEGRNVAYFLLNEHPAALSSLDAKALLELGKGMDNWTSVDTFGCYVLGPAWREGQVSDARLHRWARSKDRWWRRAALVATVALQLASRGGLADEESGRRTKAVCALLVNDHDDMVVKAMSWALRSWGAGRPTEVREFLQEHREELHPRVLREVENKLRTGLKTPGPQARRKKA